MQKNTMRTNKKELWKWSNILYEPHWPDTNIEWYEPNFEFVMAIRYRMQMQMQGDQFTRRTKIMQPVNRLSWGEMLCHRMNILTVRCISNAFYHNDANENASFCSIWSVKAASRNQQTKTMERSKRANEKHFVTMNADEEICNALTANFINILCIPFIHYMYTFEFRLIGLSLNEALQFFLLCCCDSHPIEAINMTYVNVFFIEFKNKISLMALFIIMYHLNGNCWEKWKEKLQFGSFQCDTLDRLGMGKKTK